MARYIDADRDSFPTLHQKELNDYMKGWNACLKSVLQQLTADVEEVKHGKWKEETKFIITDDPDDDGYWRTIYICSECEREEWRKEPYCPNCGAKMDGGNAE